MGMGDGDKGPGGAGAPGQFRTGFLICDGRKSRTVRGGEIGGQSDGQNVPEFPVLHRA